MKLYRSKKYKVGKFIGGNTWVHKQYEDVFPSEILGIAKELLPESFIYTVVKYNEKDQAISFICSEDFDTFSEPVVGNIIRISSDGTIKKMKKAKNPMIYHHKWLMVSDDYLGFDVQDSKDRSYLWKSIVGVDKEISSRIGRRDYWLDNIVPKLIDEDLNRSAKTAIHRTKLSRPTRMLLLDGYVQGSILHHGCGKAVYDSDKLKELSDNYAEFDPACAPDRSVLDSKYTTVISNYVMNTLPKEARLSAWRDISRCTGGNAYISIRQDKIKGSPFKDGVLTARGTFQVVIPKEEFIVEAKTFFDYAEIIYQTSSMLLIKCS